MKSLVQQLLFSLINIFLDKTPIIFATNIKHFFLLAQLLFLEFHCMLHMQWFDEMPSKFWQIESSSCWDVDLIAILCKQFVNEQHLQVPKMQSRIPHQLYSSCTKNSRLNYQPLFQEMSLQSPPFPPGSGRERGEVSSLRPLLFLPNPAHPIPTFSIAPTDREPGTGYELSAKLSILYDFQRLLNWWNCKGLLVNHWMLADESQC